MAEHIRNRHNVNCILYHLVCPAKYCRKVFSKAVEQLLWGGSFWTSGYYINTVGLYGNEEAIKKYVHDQGKTYQQIHRDQLTLF